ncbi:DUF5683 domain-containing protein [Flavobacterium sp. DGU11]|uniref:DUF5683 domain-containing protein n=1 Tax=Flavobacterium arundinis TaxID=3139143 RepID=A0ABU9HUQ7_9FLAO
MRSLLSIVILLFILTSVPAFAQEEVKVIDTPKSKDSLLLKPYKLDALAPSKAAFYSAIVPGLGQVYNKKYWKLPLVYGGMGLSLYYYTFNNNKYHEYRDAYKARLAGRPVTGQLAELGNDRLIAAQKFHQRNRDLSLLLTVGIYVLNIVDANVDAHLQQFNVNENLSLKPSLQQNQLDNKYNMSFSLTYEF